MPSLLDVYSYWTKSLDLEVDRLKQSDFLIQPILVAGINPVIRKGHWAIVAHLPFETKGYILPHFKSYEPRWELEKNAREWYYNENCETDRRVKSVYEDVKHLESYVGMGTGNVEIKITMQIMKKEGFKVQEYFNLEDETFNFQYGEVLKSPLLSEIPKELHGKARNT